MPVYFLVGPAAALIGIVSIWFVMRNRQTQKRSMYSSRRAQVERKVKAARQRTLAPRGHGDAAPTEAEIAAAVPAAMGAPAYQAPPAAPLQAWEAPATPPPATPAPAYRPQAPAYEPPPAPEFTPAAAAAAPPFAPPAPFADPATTDAQPEWTPAAPEWTPAPAPPVADLSGAPPMAPPSAAPEPVSTPAGGGASWEIVGNAPKVDPAAEPPKGKKGRDKDRQQAAQGSPWQLASGDAPNEADQADDGPKKPNGAMALAQYAVLVVGLVMVLIGVLVMVANSKVT